MGDSSGRNGTNRMDVLQNEQHQSTTKNICHHSKRASNSRLPNGMARTRIKMAQHCPHCKANITPRPLFKEENGKRKAVWKNWIVPDVPSTIFMIAVLLMAWGYAHDTTECREVLASPCQYFNESGCHEYLTPKYTEGNEQPGVDWEDINKQFS